MIMTSAPMPAAWASPMAFMSRPATTAQSASAFLTTPRPSPPIPSPPRRAMQSLLEQVLGIPLSLGTTQNAWEEASAAVAEPYQELEEALPQQPVLNCDETSSRTKKDKRWLWDVGHLIFGDVGFDLRQFRNLMPPGFSFGHPGGCILGQGLVAMAALLGKHRHHPVDPLQRNQGPPVPRMPFLSSRFASLFSIPLPTAPRSLWSRQSVTGRRFGGVGG